MEVQSQHGSTNEAKSSSGKSGFEPCDCFFKWHGLHLAGLQLYLAFVGNGVPLRFNFEFADALMPHAARAYEIAHPFVSPKVPLVNRLEDAASSGWRRMQNVNAAPFLLIPVMEL